jgi:hypothetical protein
MWQDVVRLIKWRRVRWVEFAACMRKKKNFGGKFLRKETIWSSERKWAFGVGINFKRSR